MDSNSIRKILEIYEQLWNSETTKLKIHKLFKALGMLSAVFSVCTFVAFTLRSISECVFICSMNVKLRGVDAYAG